MAILLDGAALAKKLREVARLEVAALSAKSRTPSLRVILVGNDPASETYVSSKEKAAGEVGIEARTIRLPSNTSAEALLTEVDRCNRDDASDGVLVQMPLPQGLDSKRVFDALDPLKDVDGFHPENVGLLHQGRPRFVPCTPAGVLALLDEHSIGLSGRRAVVLGRSDIVGKPMAALLTARDATVTLCHSKSPDLPSICREADVLIVAIGRPGFVTSEFVRPGAAVVDVGMNRLTALETTPAHLRSSERIRAALAARGRALVGDVHFAAVAPIAGWITPVPGGVGPLTVAMLLRNTVQAARLRRA